MKSPAALEELAQDPSYKLTDVEEKLYDLLTFQKTGKHLKKFEDRLKEKEKGPAQPELLTVGKFNKDGSPKTLENSEPIQIEATLLGPSPKVS